MALFLQSLAVTRTRAYKSFLLRPRDRGGKRAADGGRSGALRKEKALSLMFLRFFACIYTVVCVCMCVCLAVPAAEKVHPKRGERCARETGKKRERESKTKTFGGWIKFLVDKDASIPPLRFPLSLHRLWGVLNITRYAVGYLLRDLPTFLSLSLPLSRFHPPFYFAFASFRCVVVVSRGTVLLNFFRDLSSQPCNLRSSLSRVKKLPLSPPLRCDYSWKIKNTTCRLYVRRVIRCMYVWCHWWMVDQSKSFIMGHSLKKDFCYFLFIYFFFCYQRAKASFVNCEEF